MLAALHCSQIANLNQLHVYCGRSDILITRTYGECLVHQAVAGLTGTSTPPKPSLVFSGDDINLSNVYFFMPTYVHYVVVSFNRSTSSKQVVLVYLVCDIYNYRALTVE